MQIKTALVKYHNLVLNRHYIAVHDRKRITLVMNYSLIDKNNYLHVLRKSVICKFAVESWTSCQLFIHDRDIHVIKAKIIKTLCSSLASYLSPKNLCFVVFFFRIEQSSKSKSRLTLSLPVPKSSGPIVLKSVHHQ